MTESYEDENILYTLNLEGNSRKLHQVSLLTDQKKKLRLEFTQAHQSLTSWKTVAAESQF